MEEIIQKAKGSPTKQFFIKMLTRDITLEDAILDLLDNCLDGVMRTKKVMPSEEDLTYYQGFYAEIYLSDTEFKIVDNCGGMSKDTALHNAFMLGNSEEKDDEKLPTVGIYGIGMKRAIFKLGSEAKVFSKTTNEEFCVSINETWANEEDWDFPLEDVNDELRDPGVEVRVTRINPEVAILWKKDYVQSFIDELIKKIAQHYCFIIEKGFTVRVNGVTVVPNPIKVLIGNDFDGKRIAPYLYQTQDGDVSIKIVIGFYSPMIDDEEVDNEVEGRRSSHDAGLSIICNDRVVLYNNKDHLTGWGEYNVPRYHTQFIGISGVVLFRSNNPASLPMTTTKRGVDLTSPIYSHAKDKMREGLLMFTNYTNKWKGMSKKEKEISNDTIKVEMNTFLQSPKNIEDKMKITLNTRNDESIFKPKLPMPEKASDNCFVRFVKPKSEIDEVCEYLYDETEIDIKPGQVGEECFNRILFLAREEKQ